MGINPLQIYDLPIFSPSPRTGFCFILLTVSFDVKNVFILMKSNSFIFSTVYAFGVIFMKPLPSQCHESFLFSSKSCIVLCLHLDL